jgi:predicted amidohydrolase
MIVAAVQTSPVLGDTAGNIARALELASTVDAGLYVLPELYSTGYAFHDRRQAESLAEPVFGKSVSACAATAAKRKCWICGGFAERAGEGMYNSAFLAGPDGVAGVYRKTHLFGLERDLFLPGDSGFEVIDAGWARIGMMICFDWIFPEAMRTLALRGADVVLHPANLVLPYCPDGMTTRCLENRVFAITADRVGRDAHPGGEVKFIGKSQIVSPRAEVLARASDCREEVVTAEIDPAEARNKKIPSGNDLLADRRPGFYA